MLAPLTPGTMPVSFTAGTATGQLSLDIAQGDLREIAVALDATGAAGMANILYSFGGVVVEILPTMTIAEVNAALSGSNQIVFMRTGTYQGDLNFSGSKSLSLARGRRVARSPSTGTSPSAAAETACAARAL